MKPALAFPYYDPTGRQFPHLQTILPALKEHFDRAYLCPPASTRRHAGLTQFLQEDDFFTLFPWDPDGPIGDSFAFLYRQAAQAAPPDQPLHLCFLDRLSFALEGEYHDRFLADVDALTAADLPLIFQRTPLAWSSHPRNYREIEGFVTTVGRLLFGRELDYAWCHLVISAAQLGEIIPRVHNHDLSMVAEMVLQIQDQVKTREVDWLSWEDPLVLSRDPDELKREREGSPEEVGRRLAYALPMVEAMLQFALGRGSGT
jgi:hypothetical protein